jgi:hypothetical protein
MKSLRDPDWINLSGDWADGLGPVKVMAVVDNYAMVRRPKMMPFVITVKDFVRRYHRVVKPGESATSTPRRREKRG